MLVKEKKELSDLNSRIPLRVLFITLEFPRWSIARPWSYTGQLGLEEGFRANGVDFLTITTQWLPRAQEICAGKRFDQVWVEIVHNDFDGRFWEWLTTLAPVRIGMLFESLQYTAQELDAQPILRGRRARVEERFKYLTHAVAIDEEDVANINRSGLARALWWPGTVPERFIVEHVAPVSGNYAVFSGSVYGSRASWIQHPCLQGLLVHQSASDQRTVYSVFFDALQRAAHIFVRLLLPGVNLAVPSYLAALRYIRRYNFGLYLRSLRTCGAIVNLPSFVKAYPSRIPEGMAVGRPVISNEISDRPRNKSLFQDGQDILLYSASEPEQLAEQIRQVLADPHFANRIAANALCKLKHLHTTEVRINQVLEWIESGNEPNYD